MAGEEFWLGLGGLGNGVARGIDAMLALEEAKKEREQRAAEWQANRDWQAQQAEESRRFQAHQDQRNRLQQGQQFSQRERSGDIDRFVRSLGAMNVSTLDPEGMYNRLSPQQLPGQSEGNVMLPGGGQVNLGGEMQAANTRQQEGAAALRPEFMAALDTAAKQGRARQSTTPIAGFPAAYTPQEFNPNTGQGSIVRTEFDRQKMLTDLVKQTTATGVAVLKSSPEMATLRNMFANPATQEEAKRLILDRARAAMASQWQTYQQISPDIASVPFNDQWVLNVLPEILATPQGTGTGVGAGAPPPAGPASDADRLRQMLSNPPAGGRR